ncbi:serine/threonine-protein kinase [Sandaracinus amylolyticus]|uniref:serine/threonine-protein kinase n=1 Tax=Sandaracinus amylolyticus TaxID=927083 RepID=UPI001F19221B|nr:serine/threonine-protein kinase [Sandaracinus amylolyticus]
MGRIVRRKWRLDALLGMGGMAAVYAATHRNGHRVALKLLHPWLLAWPDARERFLRESYVANSIAHPGVVPVADDDEAEDGAPFLVMELLHGESLEDRIARLGPMSFSEALLVANDLLDVLAAAHAASVVHRDVKPDNVFLERAQPRGRLRLLDFGIARLREIAGEGAETRQGVLLGTPAYMSPEQALGQWNRVDARTDLWAVGATLFAMISGRPPRRGDDVRALIAASQEPLPDLRDLVPDVPEPLAKLVAKATAYDRDARFADAVRMREAVDRCRREISVTDTAISLGRLAQTIGGAPKPAAPPDTQEFERADLALSSSTPFDDEDPTHFEPIAEALAVLRAPVGEDDPTAFLTRGAVVQAMAESTRAEVERACAVSVALPQAAAPPPPSTSAPVPPPVRPTFELDARWVVAIVLALLAIAGVIGLVVSRLSR